MRNSFKGLLALAAVPWVSPALVPTRTYAVRWIEAAGLASPMRRLFGRPSDERFFHRPLAEVAREL